MTNCEQEKEKKRTRKKKTNKKDFTVRIIGQHLVQLTNMAAET